MEMPSSRWPHKHMRCSSQGVEYYWSLKRTWRNLKHAGEVKPVTVYDKTWLYREATDVLEGLLRTVTWAQAQKAIGQWTYPVWWRNDRPRCLCLTPRMHYLTLAVHTLVSSLCSCNDGVSCNQWVTLDSRHAGGLDRRDVSCFPVCGCDKTPWQKAGSEEKDSLAQNSDVENSNTAQMLRQEPEATAHIHSDKQRENGNMCANCSVHKLSLHIHNGGPKARDVCCPQSSWVFTHQLLKPG